MDRSQIRFDRRRNENFQRAVTATMLLINLGAIAYGAGRLSSSIDELRRIVTPLAIEVPLMRTDIAVIKDRLSQNQEVPNAAAKQ